MLGYATLGSNDLEKAKAFYDKVLAPLGGQRAFGSDRMQGYASAAGGGMLAVCRPYDEKAASAGNGTMIALAADTREKVDEVYKLALANGASSEGEPGERMPTFYGAYFRDLDGNKLCVFKMG